MTDWLIILFFGVALLIGIYFTWVLLRIEMRGKPRPLDPGDDFGFAPRPPAPRPPGPHPPLPHSRT
ncbi:MAG: hypothetical protein ACR2JE_04070 [Acidobacteriaceae bacterium]